MSSVNRAFIERTVVDFLVIMYAAFNTNTVCCFIIMFERLITRLTGVDGTLDPQFEAWLIALGRRDEVEKWKSSQEV